MEREVLLTGIGGQGVQLAAKTLAVAAIGCGREVMMFGTYGGSMRGGSTAATVVVGDGPVYTPPDVDEAWGAIAMHHDNWDRVRDRMRAGGIVLVDSHVFQGELDVPQCTVVPIEATLVATDLGYAQAASMIALGAFASATRLVTLESLTTAAHEVLPPYRTQHAEANAAALTAGWNLVPEPLVEAWVPSPAGSIA
jgi:Pyruvate/2-oxoacid:ferredoxin oxidoreductase gamma subunit